MRTFALEMEPAPVNPPPQKDLMLPHHALDLAITIIAQALVSCVEMTDLAHHFSCSLGSFMFDRGSLQS